MFCPEAADIPLLLAAYNPSGGGNHEEPAFRWTILDVWSAFNLDPDDPLHDRDLL